MPLHGEVLYAHYCRIHSDVDQDLRGLIHGSVLARGGSPLPPHRLPGEPPAGEAGPRGREDAGEGARPCSQRLAGSRLLRDCSGRSLPVSNPLPSSPKGKSGPRRRGKLIITPLMVHKTSKARNNPPSRILVE